MPNLVELYDSRRLTETLREGRLEQTLEVDYKIEGTDDPADTSVLALGPQKGEAYGNGSLNLFVISRKFSIMKVGGASGVLKLVVTYGPAERLPGNNSEDEPEFELNLMAETVHIEKALSQQHYPSDVNGVDLAIGVNGDKVDGVDIYVPKGTYKQTRELSTLDKKYIQTIDSLSSTINKFAWKYWEAREVLFLGAIARRKGFGVWKLEYNFAIQRNTEQQIAAEAGLQTFDKPGWDYMWFERLRKASGSSVSHAIEAIHVGQVYPETDFTLLGIGK